MVLGVSRKLMYVSTAMDDHLQVGKLPQYLTVPASNQSPTVSWTRDES